jgi:hypothetical protein
MADSSSRTFLVTRALTISQPNIFELGTAVDSQPSRLLCVSNDVSNERRYDDEMTSL